MSRRRGLSSQQRPKCSQHHPWDNGGRAASKSPSHHETTSVIPDKATPTCSRLRRHLALPPLGGTFQAKWCHHRLRSEPSSSCQPPQCMARTGGRAVAKGTGDLREQMGRHSRRARRASVHNDWPELSLDVAPKLDMGPGARCWVRRVNHTLEGGAPQGRGPHPRELLEIMGIF